MTGDVQKMSQRLDELDTSVFKAPSQTSEADRQSLLIIQKFIRDSFPKGYSYIEVGSHLGGSLAPHLMDKKCKQISSLDPRPLSQPDERGVRFYYDGNSTERMLSELKNIGLEHELTKLKTYDLDAADYKHPILAPPFELIFIDGEHTHVAAFSDFISLRSVMAENSICVFHDADLIIESILIIERLLQHENAIYTLTFLPDCICAFAFGNSAQNFQIYTQAISIDKQQFIVNARQKLREHLCALETTDLRERFADSNQVRIGLETSLATLERELTDKTNNLSHTKHQLETILRSNSWKITAPVRRLFNFFR